MKRTIIIIAAIAAMAALVGCSESPTGLDYAASELGADVNDGASQLRNDKYGDDGPILPPPIIRTKDDYFNDGPILPPVRPNDI